VNGCRWQQPLLVLVLLMLLVLVVLVLVRVLLLVVVLLLLVAGWRMASAMIRCTWLHCQDRASSESALARIPYSILRTASCAHYHRHRFYILPYLLYGRSDVLS
jgi:hypothetical protein